MSDMKTPELNANPALIPFLILVSKSTKNTGPIMMLKINPVTIPFNAKSANF